MNLTAKQIIENTDNIKCSYSGIGYFTKEAADKGLYLWSKHSPLVKKLFHVEKCNDCNCWHIRRNVEGNNNDRNNR